jgi:hypothetical protein
VVRVDRSEGAFLEPKADVAMKTGAVSVNC